MDEIDRAQDYQAREIEHALANRRRMQGESALICAECEKEIPEGRRLAAPGCTLCVSCQEEAERERQ